MPATTAPQVRFRTLDGVRIRYVGGGGSQKPAVVLARPLAGERVRVRVEPGLAVRARSPLTRAARRICDNWPGSAGARTGGRLVRVPTPRTAAIRLPCAGGQ